MSGLDDPRVYFAAERTLLAWIRTGLATTALGFVVARFGLFLRLLPSHDQPAAKPGWSLVFGIAMVVLGAAMSGGAALQFRRFLRTLSPAERPARWTAAFAITMAAGSAVCCALLAAYLAC